MTHVEDFDGIETIHVGKKNKPFKESEAFKANVEASKDFTIWAKSVLGKSVKQITHTNKLEKSAVFIASPGRGSSANYERVEIGQNGNDDRSRSSVTDKNLEI